MFHRKFEYLESRLCLSVSPVLLSDIGFNVSETNIAENSSQIEEFHEYNGEVYFRADNGTIGSELYKTDGTSEGTVLVRDINPFTINNFTKSSTPRNFHEVNGLLFFFADVSSFSGVRTELWRTDGSPEGTIRIADVNLPPDWEPAVLGGYGEYMYFNIFNRPTDATHADLWRTDGTPEGTEIVKDFTPKTPNSDYIFGVNIWLAQEFRGELYFSASDPEHGLELWKTDGTTEGTQLFFDSNPGVADSYPLSPVIVDDVMYFVADVLDDDTGETKSQIHKTNGTLSGTTRVSETAVDWEVDLLVHDGLIYFTGYSDEQGFEPHRTEGTAEGTIKLADTWTGVHEGGFEGLVTGYYAALGRVFFVSANSQQSDGLIYNTLWSTQGTPDTTVQLTDNVVPIVAELGFVEHDGFVYFSTAGSDTIADSTQDDRLGRTDGTAEGTSVIQGPAIDWRNVSPKLIYEDKLILVGRVDGTVGQELWQFDTEADTFEVIDIAPGPLSSISRAHAVAPFAFDDMLLVYAADSVRRGDELWAIKMDQPGDVDGNGIVNFVDFLVLAGNFGMDGDRAGGDLNGDGTIGFTDFLILAAEFGNGSA